MELDGWKAKMTSAVQGIFPRLGKYKYALIILLAGILLLYAGGGARDRPKDERQQERGTEAAFQLNEFEAQLCSKLKQIEGVGRVEIMLSLEQTGEAVYASNIRKSENNPQSGSYESTLSTVSDGNYGEQPVRIKETCPTFRGAVILCDGASDNRVKLAVTQAVSAVCGLGTDRISVIQMGQS